MYNYKKKFLKHCKSSQELGFSLDEVRYSFDAKPILIGGKALEYYGGRDSGNDYDFVVCSDDYKNINGLNPVLKKAMDGDLGIAIGSFEFWRSIYLFDYDFYIEGAIEEEHFFVISFEKLMFMKVFSSGSSKSTRNLDLMSKRMAYIRDIVDWESGFYGLKAFIEKIIAQNIVCW